MDMTGHPRQCKGKSKRSGQRCKQAACNGREFCKYHGGRNAVGMANGRYRHGRYSRFLPKGLLANVNAALVDPDLLDQRAEIAILTARLGERLSGVRDGDTAELWASAREAYRLYRKSLDLLAKADKRGDMEEVARQSTRSQEAMDRLGELLMAGATDHERWTDVERLTDRKRRLVESERRRVVEAAQVVGITQVAMVLNLIFQAVESRVHDPSTRAFLQSDFSGILGSKGIVEVDPDSVLRVGPDGAGAE